MGWNHYVDKDGHEHWNKDRLVIDLQNVEFNHDTIRVNKDFVHCIGESDNLGSVVYQNCPICSNEHWELIYKFREYDVYRCDRCGYMIAKDDNIEFAKD